MILPNLSEVEHKALESFVETFEKLKPYQLNKLGHKERSMMRVFYMLAYTDGFGKPQKNV